MGMKRKMAALAVTASVGAAAVGIGAGAAQASQIDTGYVQLCAFGDYDVYATSGFWSTTLVTPGNCWYGQVTTDGWMDIDVYEVFNNGNTSDSIGDAWYDSSVSGLGIGATGDANTTASIFLY
jgi:hypothetical protein